MQFQAKTEAQIQEESLIPEGEYDFTVVGAEDKISKKENPMIQLDLDVFVGDKAREMKDWLMEQMAYKLRHFCFSVGLGDKYEAGTLNASDCIGRSGKVKVVIRENGQYGKQNSVKDYVITEASTEIPVKKPSIPTPVTGGYNASEPPFAPYLGADFLG